MPDESGLEVEETEVEEPEVEKTEAQLEEEKLQQEQAEAVGEQIKQDWIKRGLELKKIRDEEDRLIALAEEYLAEQDEEEVVEEEPQPEPEPTSDDDLFK